MPTSVNPIDPNEEESVELSERIEELEKEAARGEIDLDRMIELYSKDFPRRPVWHLVQDIMRQAMIYNNLLEEAKRLDEAEYRATGIKQHYESLKLVPENSLPNPDTQKLVKHALDKVQTYGRALIGVVCSYNSDLLNEVRMQPGYTVTLQVEIGWPPALSLGVERTAEPKL
jgi:hypothetical protein